MPSVRANVKKDILSWARETAGFQVGEAARKLNVKPERIADWEGGDVKPTINQLRNMARVYKRPLSVFYLQERPMAFAVMRDFRRLPGDGIRRFSPNLTLEIRAAQQRRELMLDLLEEVEESPPRFDFAIQLDENPENVGDRIRDVLRITYQIQTQWRDTRIAFKAWRDRIEEFGVFVFQMANVEPQEVTGIANFEQVLPIIAVNRKDVYSRRIFSLFHEFAHLGLHSSGVSDLDVDAERPPEEQRIEVFCNGVSAAALIPRANFLAEQIVSRYVAGPRQWDDDEIEELAQKYSVSRESIVRRLLTFGRATDRFYRLKRQQYQAEYQRQLEQELERLKNQEFRRNPARDTLTINGAPYVRLVLNNYYQDRITLSEVASYLGIRLRHLPRVEEYLRAG